MSRHQLTGVLLLTLALWLVQDSVAYADNCGSPSDCFFTERAAIIALIAIATIAALIFFGPGAAVAVLFLGWDIAEAATGRDLLTWEETPRWVAALGIIDPTPGNVASRGGKRVVKEVIEETTEEAGERGVRKTVDDVIPTSRPGPAGRALPESGQWIAKKESKTSAGDFSRQYEEFNGGRPGKVYRVLDPTGKPVDFDSFVDGKLIESKGHYDQFFEASGEPKFWFDPDQEFMEQARRQVQAAQGQPIEWRFAENGPAYEWFREQVALEGLPINVRHVPMPQ